MLEEVQFRVQLSDGKKRVTGQSPFKLMTEERLNAKQHQNKMDEEGDSCSGGFRARKMPEYNFFEVKHEPTKKILFKEFALTTS